MPEERSRLSCPAPKGLSCVFDDEVLEALFPPQAHGVSGLREIFYVARPCRQVSQKSIRIGYVRTLSDGRTVKRALLSVNLMAVCIGAGRIHALSQMIVVVLRRKPGVGVMPTLFRPYRARAEPYGVLTVSTRSPSSLKIRTSTSLAAHTQPRMSPTPLL